LVDSDVVLTAAESVLDDALHFEKIALAHWIRFMKIYRRCDRCTERRLGGRSRALGPRKLA
jgi:hypothetical protein